MGMYVVCTYNGRLKEELHVDFFKISFSFSSFITQKRQSPDYWLPAWLYAGTGILIVPEQRLSSFFLGHT